MDVFEPMRDFFQRRAAKRLTDTLPRVQLITECHSAQRGTFVFPGSVTLAAIHLDEQAVGFVDYGLNPLGDRLYLNLVKLESEHQRQGVGLVVLWQLWLSHQVPMVPIHPYAASQAFWLAARPRLAAAGAQLEAPLHVGQLEEAKKRWQHQVPEHEHERLLRQLQASPEWPQIRARFAARKPS